MYCAACTQTRAYLTQFPRSKRAQAKKTCYPTPCVTVAASDSTLGTHARTAVERQTVVQDTRVKFEVHTAHAEERSLKKVARRSAVVPRFRETLG